MPQSLSNVLVHTVFSTIDRLPLIPGDVRQDLYAYLGGTFCNLNCQPVQIGGTADHVHILFRMTRTSSLSGVVEKMKSASSKWVKTKGGVPADFRWQAGYGAFSVSPEREARVAAYIRDQERRHERLGFQDELRALLAEAGLEFDERYLWD